MVTFEKTMSEVEAITGAVGSKLDSLKRSALKLGEVQNLQLQK